MRCTVITKKGWHNGYGWWLAFGFCRYFQLSYWFNSLPLYISEKEQDTLQILPTYSQDLHKLKCSSLGYTDLWLQRLLKIIKGGQFYTCVKYEEEKPVSFYKSKSCHRIWKKSRNLIGHSKHVNEIVTHLSAVWREQGHLCWWQLPLIRYFLSFLLLLLTKWFHLP